MSVLCKLKYLIETEVPEEKIFISIKDMDDGSDSVVDGIEKLENEIDELEIDVAKEDNRFDSDRGEGGSVDTVVDEDYYRIPFEVKVANLGDMDIVKFVKAFFEGEITNKHLSYGEEDEIKFELKPRIELDKKFDDNHALFKIEWDLA